MKVICDEIKINFDELTFTIWHTECDRNKGECENEDGSSEFWGGKEIGTLQDIISVTENMARQNACAEASYNGELIYHSSSDGIDNLTVEWGKTLLSEAGKKEFHSLIAPPSKVLSFTILDAHRKGTYLKGTKGLLSFMDKHNILASYIQELENIGNEYIEELFSNISNRKLSSIGFFADENFLQWDCAVTDIDWEEINSLFEEKIKHDR